MLRENEAHIFIFNQYKCMNVIETITFVDSWNENFTALSLEECGGKKYIEICGY